MEKNDLLQQTSLYFDKLMGDTKVSKRQILLLKKKIEVINSSDGTYTTILDRVTKISNSPLCGKSNTPKILGVAYDEFKNINNENKKK